MKIAVLYYGNLPLSVDRDIQSLLFSVSCNVGIVFTIDAERNSDVHYRIIEVRDGIRYQPA